MDCVKWLFLFLSTQCLASLHPNFMTSVLARLHDTEQCISEFRTNFINVTAVCVSSSLPPWLKFPYWRQFEALQSTSQHTSDRIAYLYLHVSYYSVCQKCVAQNIHIHVFSLFLSAPSLLKVSLLIKIITQHPLLAIRPFILYTYNHKCVSFTLMIFFFFLLVHFYNILIKVPL